MVQRRTQIRVFPLPTSYKIKKPTSTLSKRVGWHFKAYRTSQCESLVIRTKAMLTYFKYTLSVLFCQEKSLFAFI